MRLLGTEGIDVNAKDEKDYTPLHWACVKGLKRVALALVQGVINVNAMNVHNMTALHYVCHYGHTEVALALIDHKDISANATNPKSKETPLHYACQRGDTKVALALIAHEAVNVNAKDKRGKTALYYARKKDLSGVVAQLINSAAAQESAAASAPVDANNLLYAAAQDGHLDEVTKLIAAGADVYGTADDGKTPLYAAASNGHLDVVTKLIAAGADVNAACGRTNLSTSTPLVIAAANGHLTVVTKLIAAGALVDGMRHSRRGWPGFVAHAEASCYYGHSTPLNRAAQFGHLTVVTKLIAAGANVDKIYDCDHSTPLYDAARFGHLDVVTKLIEAGADVNKAPRWSGNTPLCIAAHNGRTAVVSKLLQHGADKSIRGRQYGTPLEAVERILANDAFQRSWRKNHGETDWASYHVSSWHKNHAAIVALLA
jgi:ankyrin repeat protein